MPNLVDVPENAVREEPLAFGLTAPQLLVCGIAVGDRGRSSSSCRCGSRIQIVLIVLLAGPGAAGRDPADPRRARVPLAHPLRSATVRGPRTWHVSAGEVAQ